ncbi:MULTISPECIES: 3-hydroxyacyl-ACP dehydratase FabZ [Spiribacter]|jgi:3-hydroxyacyl-[acyl-carrier-protein] dehydratase|nr:MULTISPECIES: 3-hydroxyacyl-ACP dehydratase FabZ [Spiribacter]
MGADQTDAVDCWMGPEAIRERLPHRYPFLMVDQVVDYTPGESISALRNVSASEPWVPGHFPEKTIMPGVLLVESMAQACGLLAYVTREAEPDVEMPATPPLFYLVGVDEARFKQPACPGDQLAISARLDRVVRGIWLFKARIEVNGRLVTSAGIRCTMGAS